MYNYFDSRKLPNWPSVACFDSTVHSKIAKFCFVCDNDTEALFIITIDDRVLAAGNSGDHLCIEINDNSLRSIEITALRNKNVLQFVRTSALLYMFALTRSGEVWGWGAFKCSLPAEQEGLVYFKQPRCISNLPSIATLAAGDDAVIALGHNGSVYYWEWIHTGESTNILARVEEMNLPTGEIAVAIDAGESNYWVITHSGRLYHYRMKNIRLHHEGDEVDIWTPTEVLLPADFEPIQTIASNDMNAIFVIESGRVYICHYNALHNTFKDLQLLSEELDMEGFRFKHALWMAPLRNHGYEDTIVLIDEHGGYWKNSAVNNFEPRIRSRTQYTGYYSPSLVDFLVQGEPFNMPCITFECGQPSTTLRQIARNRFVQQPLTIRNCLQVVRFARTTSWINLQYAAVSFIRRNRDSLERYLNQFSRRDRDLGCFIMETEINKLGR